MRRILRFLIILPALCLVWAASNSLGITQTFDEATGLDVPTSVTIPVLRDLADARRAVDASERAVGRKAVKGLRSQVRKRFGSKAARLVPTHLSPGEALRISKLVAGGISLDGLKKELGSAGGQENGGNAANDGQQSGVEAAINGNAKMFNRARQQLATLAVKGRAPKTGYSRDQFGTAWSDSAGDSKWTDNSCDTRDDVLARDLVHVSYESGSDCTVATGIMRYERYTGHTNVKFVRGGDYANAFDIEHVVALGDAWVTGAQKLSAAQRAALANDPIELFAADPSSNRQKGDADAASWLPPNKPYRCAYVSAQIRVKAKYHLWVTPPEKAAMQRVLSGCAR